MGTGSVVTERRVNATVGSLLGFLHAGPQSGWDLVKTAEQTIGGFWSLTQSQIYRELTGMAKDGLIRADEVGARERRPYRLTDAGRAAFVGWIDQSPGEEQIRFPLLLTMAFGQHLAPERLSAMLGEHRARHAARLRGYRADLVAARKAGAAPHDLVTLDFGIRYEAAVLSWFDHLPAPVDQVVDDIVRPLLTGASAEREQPAAPPRRAPGRR